MPQPLCLGVWTIGPASGTVLNAGTQTLTARFTPTDTINYKGATSTVQIVVSKAPLTITAEDKSRAYNVANPTFTAKYDGFVNGDTVQLLTSAGSLATTAIKTSPVGSYPVTVTGASSTNYSITPVAGSLTVTQAVSEITWAAPSAITYGTGLSSIQLNATANVAGAFEYTPVVGTVLNAGTQTLTAKFTPTDAVNYMRATGTVQLVVNKAPLTITAEDKTRAYNVSNPVFTAKYAGFVNGDTYQTLTTPVGLTTTATKSSAVGSYPITASGAVAANYSISYIAGSLTVTQTSSEITWATPVAITYGAGLSSAQLNATANVAGAFEYTPVVGTVLNAGTQTLTAKFTPTDAVNYKGATGTVQLVVNKAPLAIIAEDKTRAYNVSNPVFTAKYAGFVNGDTYQTLTTPVGLTTTATKSSAVGSYPITASGAVAANYNISYVAGSLAVTQACSEITWATPTAITYGTGLSLTQLSATANVAGAFEYTPIVGTVLNAGTQTLTAKFTPTDAVNYKGATGTVQLVVNKAPLTITAEDKTRAYNVSNPVFTAKYAGFVNGDTYQTLTTSVGLTTTATKSSAVGSYPITASGAVAANYSISYVAGSLTVTQASSEITWATPAAITYGAGLSSAQLNATANVAGAFEYTPVVGTVLNAGTQTLTAKFTPTDAVNYKGATGTVQLVVNKAPLTITAEDKTRAYNVSNPVFTAKYAGFVNGDTYQTLTNPVGLTTIATKSSAVGSYPITASGAVAANYSISYIAGSLAVTQASSEITWATPAAITYGTGLSLTQLNATGNVVGAFEYTPIVGTVLNAGTQTLTARFTPADTINYKGATGTVQLVVNKAPLTITAEDKTRAYNVSNPVFTAKYAGFVNGDTYQTLTTSVGLTTTATKSSAVGSYPITASGAVAANYSISYVAGSLTVTQASSDITWATPTAITYGTGLSLTQLNATANVAGAFEYTPVVGTVLNAGTQTLTARFTPTDAVNYKGATGTVQMVVNKAPLTITAEDKTRAYNVSNPVFTAKYAGFVNGDTYQTLTTSVGLTTTATKSSAVGSYPITASGAVAANYSISYIAGSLTVTQASSDITWATPTAITYGAGLSSAQLNATANVAGAFEYIPVVGLCWMPGRRL